MSRMMGQYGIQMNITCDKDEILEKLRANLEQHSKLVAEARDGYVKRAATELEKKLALVREGKVVSLSFHLKVPKDYSTVYKTAIQMLEHHQEERIVLSATEFRQLVEDEWDWTREFFGSNSAYSAGTREYGLSKGVHFSDED